MTSTLVSQSPAGQRVARTYAIDVASPTID